MIDILALNAAIQGLRGISEALRAGYSVRNANEIAAKVSDVYAQLMPFLSAAVEAKENELTLHNRIGELEKENMTLKDWSHEKERYQLTEIAPGIPAFALKTEMESGKKTHHLCANCFEKREKSYLQSGPSSKEWSCSQCGGSWLPTGGRPVTFQVIRD